jgi:hypothetical protein
MLGQGTGGWSTAGHATPAAVQPFARSSSPTTRSTRLSERSRSSPSATNLITPAPFQAVPRPRGRSPPTSAPARRLPDGLASPVAVSDPSGHSNRHPRHPPADEAPAQIATSRTSTCEPRSDSVERRAHPQSRRGRRLKTSLLKTGAVPSPLMAWPTLWIGRVSDASYISCVYLDCIGAHLSARRIFTPRTLRLFLPFAQIRTWKHVKSPRIPRRQNRRSDLTQNPSTRNHVFGRKRL